MSEKFGEAVFLDGMKILPMNKDVMLGKNGEKKVDELLSRIMIDCKERE